PIGRPIANTSVYVLDRRLNPVPVGLPGELCISGDGLACGYLNRPDLTGEKFVPSPFDPGARLYKTGDLVRHRTDGKLEFLGRLDNQAKLRGFRIELGEIEAALNQHPAVQDSVVVSREDRLVAYVVPSQKSPTSKYANEPLAAVPAATLASELRGFLKEKLPEYMIPSAFVPLESFPLNANGKVDRQALPAPEVLGTKMGASWIAPRTEAERVIAAIWHDLLGLELVGANDNFFDLGGHSLLMVRLQVRLSEAFETEVSMMDLFRCPTISALAGLLSPEYVASAPMGYGGNAESGKAEGGDYARKADDP